MAKVLITSAYRDTGSTSPSVSIATSVVEVPAEVARRIVNKMNNPARAQEIKGLQQRAEILEE